MSLVIVLNTGKFHQQSVVASKPSVSIPHGRDGCNTEVDAALAREDFAAAMAALAGLRGPVDAFFAKGSTIGTGLATTDQKISNWNAERNSSTDFNPIIFSSPAV